MKRSWKRLSGILGACGITVFLAFPGFGQVPGPIAELISGLRVGEPATYRSMVVFPLLRAAAPQRNPGRPEPETGADQTDPATLDQALEAGWLVIEEREGGTVPEVLLTNLSGRTIFIMGGEILSGCRQDRIVRRDVLVRPNRKRLSVPVYCVEQGRWTFESDSFGSEQNLGTYALRATAQKGAEASQWEIWDQVEQVNEKMGVSSGTGAFQDALRDRKTNSLVSDAARTIHEEVELSDRTVGVVVCMGERIVGIDIFGSGSLFRLLWPKILRSAALSAHAEDESAKEKPGSGEPVGGSGVSPSPEAAEEVLRGLAAVRPRAEKAVDLGEELWAETRELRACCILHKGGVIHLGAFRADAGASLE